MAGEREGTASFTYHGGNVAAARSAFPDAPQPWIDLSTGINGRPYPIGALEAASFERLPEPGAVVALETAAACAYGADPACVIAAPGTQALIQWLQWLFPARRVGVLGFSYAEHARVWGRAGAVVEVVEEAAALAGFDVAVVVNPNNPDGRLVAPDRLADLADRVGLLVVDEAFVDVMPDGSSLVPKLPSARTIILRSFGKTYGLAGLRLGFAVASPDLAPAIRDALGPWAVAGPALAVGCRALDDSGWLKDTIVHLKVEAARLDALLANAGARIVGGTPLFRLAQVRDGKQWFEHLGCAGILVRPFAERPEWLRFGIPAQDRQWERLSAALIQAGTRARPFGRRTNRRSAVPAHP